MMHFLSRLIQRWFYKKRLLLRCRLRGIFYYEAASLFAADALKIGQALCLKREVANPHDYFAVAVYHQNGKKIGYLPREQNRVIANLLDQCENLSIIITDIAENKTIKRPISVEIHWVN